ncbi:MAG: AraC family transcriptional regulator [Opitutaceae bacterium]|nr:AraC family transcriptional regulator [Opitutaceae bacterium]
MNRQPPLYRRAGQPRRVDAHRPLLTSIRAGKIDFHALGRGHYPGRRLAPGQLPGLLSLGFWDARGDQDWGMDFHRNEGVEICLLETGSMRFAVDHATHPLGPGDLTITRPWQIHRQGDPHISAGRLHWATIAVGAQRPDQPWHWPGWVLLAPEDRAELTRRLRLTESPVWRASPEVVRSFQRMAAAVAGETADRRISRVAVGLNELLLGVLDMLRAENRAERPRLASPEHSVELFLADLRQNLNSLEKDWKLATMAATCGMGTTRFSRLCRRLTNDSPVRYLHLARLEAAARLLRTNPARSVTDIAFDCGFQSSQYFANQFRRRFGQTPTEYRKRADNG